MRKLFASLVLILWSVPLAAADLAGTWKMTAEGQTALLLTITKTAPDKWSARVLRPEGMAIDDGATISGMKAAASERTMVSSSGGTGDRLELKFDPAKPGEDRLRLLLKALDNGHAELIFSMAGAQAKSIALRRAVAADAIATQWADAVYRIDAAWPDDAEMARMFAEDQSDRSNHASIDWSVVTPRDDERRKRTRELLDQGRLRSASDFYAAAFIFQHGDKPEDFLLAHSLAVASAARGEPGAAWIAAATLDRYLQKIGQGQIYGTQFVVKKGEAAHQGTYDRALVPDALRAALGVPSLAAQDQQRSEWDAQMNAKP